MSHKRRTTRRTLTRFEAAALLGAAVLLGGGYWLYSSDASARNDDGQAERSASQIRDVAVEWKAANPRGCPTLTQLQREGSLGSDVEDPWGARFRIRCDDDGVTVFSPGEDGKLGTADDVTSQG